MLGRPSTDPHGAPIPTSGGEVLERTDLPSLVSCALNTPCVLVRVADQRTEFLQLLERHGLKPGRRLVVADRDELADVVEVVPERGEPLRLGFRAGSRLLVEAAPVP